MTRLLEINWQLSLESVKAFVKERFAGGETTAISQAIAAAREQEQFRELDSNKLSQRVRNAKEQLVREGLADEPQRGFFRVLCCHSCMGPLNGRCRSIELMEPYEGQSVLVCDQC